jgi:hypothetical protein
MSEIDRITEARVGIKAAADGVLQLRKTMVNGEAIANVMLAYRHLEDASMRLGKAIQALDGGVSVYDKATTTVSVV